MITKLATFFITLLIISLFHHTPVSAHVLLTSGTIGATVHIEPEDDPYVGKPSNFYFEFKDKQNKFKPTDCECKISITKDGTEIYSYDLFSNTSANDINSPVFQFTFPEKAVYNLKITGTPKSANSFNPFEINHTVRVSREATNNSTTDSNTNNNSSPHFFHYLAAALALIVFTVILILDRKGKGKKNKIKKTLTALIGISLLTPIIYASSHFSQDHLLIADHQPHPCCFVASPQTPAIKTITLSQYYTPILQEEKFTQPEHQTPKSISTRAPPTS